MLGRTRTGTRHPIVQHAVHSDCAPDQLCRRQSPPSSFIKKVFPNAHGRERADNGARGNDVRMENPGLISPFNVLRLIG